MSIRSFVAIPVGMNEANTLGDCAAKMTYQDKSNAVRWVDQSNYHITLAFLGEQNESDLEALAERLDEVLPEFGISVPISHLSPFPESKPKLIAAIIDKTAEIVELHQQVISSISACGLNFDKRKFLPHITLGRFRHSRNSFVGTIPSNIDIQLRIDEVAIYESVLTSSGAEYEALFRFPLDDLDYHEVE